VQTPCSSRGDPCPPRKHKGREFAWS
jgi:hypothetical protein